MIYEDDKLKEKVDIIKKSQTPKVPFISHDIFQTFRWMERDVVVSAGAKQGTTWCLNIVHQLRTGSDGSFEELGAECPFLEFVEYPGQDYKERIDRWRKSVFKKYSFRVFKTHAAPPTLPLSPNVKYIVPVRNSKDTAVSMYHFQQRYSIEFRAMWDMPPPPPPPFDVFLESFLNKRRYWGFINDWMPHRVRENVLMIHFTDLKKDLEGNIKKIAEFLGLAVPDDNLGIILEKSGFEWMKKNSNKFEGRIIFKNSRVIQERQIIRKGIIGDYKSWFTPKQEARWNAVHKQEIPDDALRAWCDYGGELPA